MRLYGKKMVISVLVLFLTNLAFPLVSLAADSAPADSRLVAYYKFDGDFKDSSGKGSDGTSVGDITFFKDGAKGQSAFFNGTGYINVNSAPALSLTGKGTISVWVKVDPSMSSDGNKNGSIISKLDEANNYNNYHFYTRGTFGARMDGRFTNGEKSVFTKSFEDWKLNSDWSHLVFSYDGSTLYLYYNGELKATKVIGNNVSLLQSVSKMRIGTGNDLNNSALFFKGQMDELKIYDYALSDGEIKNIFNTTRTFDHSIVLQVGNPMMLVDGVEKEIDPGNGTKPVVVSGRTMVPIRAIIEAMGGSLAWDEEEKRIDLTLNTTTLKFWVNKTTAQLNGETLSMAVPPQVINNRTMVPLRFVSENLGCTVQWDGAAQKITILYNNPKAEEGGGLL